MKTETERKKEKKQARARARRAAQTNKISKLDREISAAYKPLEEWDEEELARGRPRNIDGKFSGPAPRFVSRQIHEEAIRRFKEIAGSEMRALVPKALDTIQRLIMDDSVDENGKPLVPPSVRLEAAKWTVEHLVGKPTQRQELDISVRLQSILGQVMVVAGDDDKVLPAIARDFIDVDEVDGESELRG